ncbi:multidrug resistance efflux transporter family protein [Paraflavisolibacter sp. H34]|uniref:DMT family transporter n=1 Tax=Huijunlia imazamoxiresistens TaxID=3127457 RepID=UPI00301734DD
MMKTERTAAISLSIISSLFFALTFMLNRFMALSGGSWVWSSSLRYFFMVPFLLVLVAGRKKLRPLLAVMRQAPGKWLLWSTVAFGLFYAPLTFAAAYGPSWLVAGTWQVTIICGMLVAPLLEPKPIRSGQRFISPKALLFSLVILAGVALLQAGQAGRLTFFEMLSGTLPVLVGALAYPLGNRMMMKVAGGQLDAFQRTLGMTLASLPFWLLVAAGGLAAGLTPSAGQAQQSLLVALASGVIATSLFFRATDLARHDQQLLASVEATQSGEVLFALLGEMLLLGAPLPGPISLLGMALVIAGMVLHSLLGQKQAAAPPASMAEKDRVAC